MADCTCADPSAVADAINSNANTISNGHKTDTDTLNATFYGKSHGGKEGAIDVIRFCRWAAPEVSGRGHVAWSIAYQAAALALAFANAAFQSQINDKKMDIADKWASHAEEKWYRFANRYKPIEEALSREIQGYTNKVLDCDDSESRANDAVSSSYSTCLDVIKRKAKAARICVNPTLTKYVKHRRSISLVDCTNYNLRDDNWWKDNVNDILWSRRSSFIDLGRNLPAQAMEYGKVANQLMTHVGQQVTDIAGTLVTQLGYFGARQDTFSPMTFLAGGSSTLRSPSLPVGVSPIGGNYGV